LHAQPKGGRQATRRRQRNNDSHTREYINSSSHAPSNTHDTTPDAGSSTVTQAHTHTTYTRPTPTRKTHGPLDLTRHSTCERTATATHHAAENWRPCKSTPRNWWGLRCPQRRE
jgi:hypothetical protein